MSAKPKIRELRPTDMDSYADLCADRPGLSRRQAEKRATLVEWIAFNNPHSDGGPTYMVAEAGDRLLAHLGRMPTRFHVGGGVEQAAYIHDLFAHPELQQGGRGFFVSMQMYRKCEKATDNFCALIWTNEINIKIQKLRKYEQTWANLYARVLRPDLKLKRFVKSDALMAAAGPAARALLKLGDEVISRAHSARRKFERIYLFDERFDAFDEGFGGKLGIAPAKDSAYLNWKYAQRPFLDSAAFGALDDSGKLVGYVVVAMPEPPDKEALILELNALPGDAATLAGLLNKAIAHATEIGAISLAAVASRPDVVAQLKRHLFRPRQPPQPLFFAQTKKAKDPAGLLSPEAWNLGYGDSEGPILAACCQANAARAVGRWSAALTGEQASAHQSPARRPLPAQSQANPDLPRAHSRWMQGALRGRIRRHRLGHRHLHHRWLVAREKLHGRPPHRQRCSRFKQVGSGCRGKRIAHQEQDQAHQQRDARRGRLRDLGFHK